LTFKRVAFSLSTTLLTHTHLFLQKSFSPYTLYPEQIQATLRSCFELYHLESAHMHTQRNAVGSKSAL